MCQWAFVERPARAQAAKRSSTTSTPKATSAPTWNDPEGIERRRSTLEDLRRPALCRRSSPPASGRATSRMPAAPARRAREDDERRGHDFELERALIRDHLKDLEMNRYPQISKKLGRRIETSKRACKRLARLHPHPGKQIGGDDAPPITPDAIIYYDEETRSTRSR
jgi:hypothetical protein